MIKRISILVLLLILFGCKETIIHDLSESESNKIITKLHSNQIDAEKKKQADGRWSIAVDKSKSAEAIHSIEMNRIIPRTSLDDRKSSGMGSSREEQKFSIERSISSELEETLNQIPGVLESRVHLTLPATDPVFGTRLEKSVSSASVLLIVEPEAKIVSSDVGQLIAGASGIPAKDVSVLQTIVSSKTAELYNSQIPQFAPTSNFKSVLPMVLLFVGGVALLTVGFLRRQNVSQRTT